MKSFFPFIEWFKSYKKEFIRPDLVAGITVGTVLVPQSMAYAMLAGLPPIYGLYAAAVTPIIGALWVKSGILGVGPLALVSLLTATALAPFAQPESPEYIALAIMLAFMVGVIFLLMGIFKLGFIFRFVSYPVIVGILSAIAIIIALSQVRHILGITVPRTEFIHQMFVETMRNIADANPYTIAVALLSFGIIYGGYRIHKYFPGALIAAILTTLLAYYFDLRALGVKTVGDMPVGLPIPTLPYMDIEMVFHMLSSALVIAIMGFVQVVALTKVIASKTGQKADLNQDLIGHGAANLIGSFFHSYPVTSSASRTAVNLRTGAKTGMSIVICGVIVLLTLLFLTPLFYYLPRATLGAIVFAAALSMIQYNPFTKVYRASRLDGSIALITFLLALVLKPDYAIFIGIGISLILFLRSSITPEITVLTRNPKTEVFEDSKKANLPTCPQILYLRPDFAIYFANAGYIRDSVLDMVKERKNGLKYVLMDFEAVSSLDTTGVDELSALIKDMEQYRVELYIANVHASVREVLNRSIYMKLLKRKCCLNSKGESITLLFNKIDHKYCKDTCPYSVFWECETVKQ
jgi:SulP family sulfate permease